MMTATDILQVAQDEGRALTSEESERISNALKAGKRTRNLSCRLGRKGGVSIYGLNGRFPVTLYANQWAKLFDFFPTLQEYIDSDPSEMLDVSDKNEPENIVEVHLSIQD